MADERNQGSKDSIGMYTVQCYRCKKFREIQTKQEFEAIRERVEDHSWFCCRDLGAGRSCEQPGDVPFDSSRIWLMDKPGIPRPPPETERLLFMRRDLSKMDTYYVMPNGKRARAGTDVERFLEENPGYRATMPASRFSFATPKIVRETVAESSQWRAARADQRERSEGSSLCRASRADQRERSEGSSVCWASKADQRGRSEESSRWRAARADQRERSVGSSLCRSSKADQRERSEENSRWRAARVESKNSEDTDVEDSDYHCSSSSGGSE